MVVLFLRTRNRLSIASWHLIQPFAVKNSEGDSGERRFFGWNLSRMPTNSINVWHGVGGKFLRMLLFLIHLIMQLKHFVISLLETAFVFCLYFYAADCLGPVGRSVLKDSWIILHPSRTLLVESWFKNCEHARYIKSITPQDRDRDCAINFK